MIKKIETKPKIKHLNKRSHSPNMLFISYLDCIL